MMSDMQQNLQDRISRLEADIAAMREAFSARSDQLESELKALRQQLNQAEQTSVIPEPQSPLSETPLVIYILIKPLSNQLLILHVIFLAASLKYLMLSALKEIVIFCSHFLGITLHHIVLLIYFFTFSPITGTKNSNTM